MEKSSILVILFLLVTGCGPSAKEYAESRQREVALQAQVEALRAELEDIKFGATRLLAQAKLASESENEPEAKKLLIALIDRHPVSIESAEAKVLLSQVESRIVALEEERRKAEEKANEEVRLRIERAMRNMKRNTDEFAGITWVSHINDTFFAENDIRAYFGTKSGLASGYPLRLKIQYGQKGWWIYARSITIKADDKIYELGKMNFKRDTASSDRIREWVDFPVEDHAMLNHLITANRLVIRFHGEKYVSDYTVPEHLKSQLFEVYNAWITLGGKP